jgi:type II secretory pathway component GspD/PulD (secretin)/tetratricopeptide (TPR) repeat protein
LLGIVTGLVLTPAAVDAAPATTSLLSVVSAAVAPAQSSPRPPRASLMLNSAIECHQRGEYEAAATLFQQCQAVMGDLPAADQTKLTNWVQINAAALKARKDATAMLRQAEVAHNDKKTSEAADLIKKVLPNMEYLSTPDKQRAKKLGEVLHVDASAAPADTGSPGALARAKLKQGRTMLAQGNFSAAQQLANEAIKLKALYTPNEDTPTKLLDDCAKTQKDAKALLALGRAAYERKDYERAEQLAQAAEKESSTFTFALSSDSPTKLMKECQSARATAKAGPAVKPAEKDKKPVEKDKKPAEKDKESTGMLTSVKSLFGNDKPEDKDGQKPPTGTPIKPAVDPVKKDTPDPKAEAARQLLKQGRDAFKAGDLAKAKSCAAQAREKGPDLKWWDDTPEKLLADVARAEGAKTAAGAAAQVSSLPKDDPKALLKQGRDLYAAGKLEEAAAAALKAQNASASVKWGLFEDSPDNLMKDIDKARVKRDQDESIKVMADARKMMEKGDLDDAMQATFKAEKLHGPYGLWDLGDRPQKLRAEIETAKAKTHKTVVPPVPGDLAKNDKNEKSPKNDKKGGPSLGAPVDDPRAAQQAKKLLADARIALKSGDVAKAETLTAQAEHMQSVYKLGEDNPAAVRHDIDQVRLSLNGGKPAKGGVNVGFVDNGKKQQALELIAECQRCQQAGQLIEARKNALAAQAVGASFTAEEVNPEQVLLQLSAIARQQIDSLMLQCNDCMSGASSNPALFDKAESNLMKARELAVGFGQDTITLDSKLAWVKQTRDQAGSVTKGYPIVQPVNPQPNDGTPRGRGLEMLAKVDQLLRSGDTVKARKIAEEVYQGPFGLQGEAAAKLRSIDAEEEGQRRLTAARMFDAGDSAYKRGDYKQACNIMQAIDFRTLDIKRQKRMNEVMQTAEMQPYKGTAIVKVGGDDGPPAKPGKAKATDGQSDYLSQVQAMQEVKFQKLREDGLNAQRQSAEAFKAGETDRALQVLEEYLSRLPESQLDAERVTLLRRPVQARLEQFKMMKAQRDQQTKIEQAKLDKDNSRIEQFRAEENKQVQVGKLMKEFHNLMKEGKYSEAEAKAMIAHELDPDNPMAVAGIDIAKISRNRDEYKKGKDDREKMFLHGADDAEEEGPYTQGMKFPEGYADRVKNRREIMLPVIKKKSDEEKQIERSLNSPVTLNFKETPLDQVIQDLRGYQNINIFVDEKALKEEGVPMDKLVSMHLEQLKLKSALNLMLGQMNLTYVVEDDVLKITTKEHAKGKLVTKIVPVADLVISIPDFGPPPGIDVYRSYDRASTPARSVEPNAQPYAGPGSLGTTGTSVGAPSSGQFASGSNQPTITKSGAKDTMQEQLMALIMNTVEPKSWATQGGQGTIDYYPLTLSLAINQTPDIIDQITELLAALRRLQDQEVAVEVRFISIAEGFYERIGLNFDVNIKTNSGTSHLAPQLTTSEFAPGNFPNTFDPSRFITGLTPAGTFTHDLNIPINQSSFGMAIPPFGGFPNAPGANGGLDIGLAFLSEIQVFMFMEAAQGDQRTNVMQAPKLSLFNGQTSTLTVSDQQFFVTNVQVIPNNGQLTFLPQVQNLATGSSITIQAVISADRRFVRMSLTPTLTNLASAVVPLFPIVTPVTTTFDGNFSGAPVLFTQFIQQPVTNTISVNTTVSVPDGGTVLMGGLKRLSEGRNEFGPPILSKIPYINRLFKNVGYGREVESLMIMVTPRIIINEEEEIRQTGVYSNPQPQ